MAENMINVRLLDRQLRKIRKQFKEVASPRAMQRVLKASFEEPMEMIQGPAQSNAPMGPTGRLKRNVKAKSYFIIPRKDFAANIYVDAFGMRDRPGVKGLGAYYGLWVEQGHRIVPPKSGTFKRARASASGRRTVARHFMRKAWDARGTAAYTLAMNQIAKRILNTIERGTARQARGG